MIDHLAAMGGGERALTKILRLLPEDRFRCSLVTLRGKAHDQARSTLTCPIYEFQLRRTYGWNSIKAAYRIRDLIKANEVDVVHTFFESSNIWGGFVAKLAGVPVLISSRRDMGILRSGKHYFGYRLINPLCDRVVAVSDEVRKWCITQERIKASKVVTVYNGIELSAIDTVTCPDGLGELNLPDSSQIVVTVANIRRIKGIDVLARAAALVTREFPNAMFLIIGAVSGPAVERDTAEQLHDLVHRLGIERNFKLLGVRNDVVPLLKSSRLFCMLSRSEGFSNAILEAMACGLPCVVTRVGGNAEAITDGDTGFLVPSEDYEAAAERVCRLLRDPVKATEMGRAARAVVADKFSSKRMIDELATLYESLVTEKAHGNSRH